MRRAKAGRRREDGVIDAGLGQRFQIGVKAAETFFRRHPKRLLRPGGLFGKDVRDGDDLGVGARDFGGVEEVFARTRAAATHADDDGVERALGLGMQERWKIRGGGSRGGRER